MSIQSELTRIADAVTAIKTAIAGKDVTVPDGTKVDGLAALIDKIETSGSGATIENTTVGELPLLSVVKFGRWNGLRLFWYVCDTNYDGHCIMRLINNQLPALAYDAYENGGKAKGNPHWALSNIRQFFNATSNENWFVAQGENDVLSSEYEGLPGFLSEFTQNELACIVPFTSKCVEYSSESQYNIAEYSDLVWLPSKKMAGGSAGTAEGSRAFAGCSTYSIKELGITLGSSIGYFALSRTENGGHYFGYLVGGDGKYYLPKETNFYVPHISINTSTALVRYPNSFIDSWDV